MTIEIPATTSNDFKESIVEFAFLGIDKPLQRLAEKLLDITETFTMSDNRHFQIKASQIEIDSFKSEIEKIIPEKEYT